MGSFSPGGSYLVSKWTIEKAEFYGRVLEDGKLIEVIRKEVKDSRKSECRKAGWLIICNKILYISFQNAAINAEFSLFASNDITDINFTFLNVPQSDI
jgi:hypothetical protein